ncbi:MAG TPA: Gfo/Idh/MocA family oxidoreductase [Sphingomicrobium sp.]|jgi:predicted dehydrogenase|nr:Gfo/Idh/MocA family oxidoreductase [Sphingomicrobium sp.]
MKPLRIAVIGYGKIAEDQHVPSIEGNPRFELVATSSRSGQGVGEKFTDWRALIRGVAALDAVAITTPPGPRYEITRECVQAGLHCLLEKPPTTGLAEIADLECLAEAKGVSLFTTWHAQHHSTVEAAAKALAGKRIKSMQIHWHEDVHKWHPGQQWIWEPGGFGVFDPGINAFSIATKIFPGGLFVQAADLSIPENAQTPIAADVTFYSPEADGPLTASLDWRRTEGEEWTITLETADGTTVRLENGGARLILDGEPKEDSGIGEYPDIYRTFADLIDTRRSLVDVAPLRLVADCLLVGGHHIVEAVTADGAT